MFKRYKYVRTQHVVLFKSLFLTHIHRGYMCFLLMKKKLNKNNNKGNILNKSAKIFSFLRRSNAVAGSCTILCITATAWDQQVQDIYVTYLDAFAQIINRIYKFNNICFIS